MMFYLISHYFCCDDFYYVEITRRFLFLLLQRLLQLRERDLSAMVALVS